VVERRIKFRSREVAAYGHVNHDVSATPAEGALDARSVNGRAYAERRTRRRRGKKSTIGHHRYVRQTDVNVVGTVVSCASARRS